MKIAVITPYYKEPTNYLIKCHESVQNQSLIADHFFIADGYENKILNKLKIKHIVLPEAHLDNGNYARWFGSKVARDSGYDFFAYLDADNWFLSNHLSSMYYKYLSSRSDIITSFRFIFSLEEKLLCNVPDNDELDLKHVDTSCYFLHKNVFDLIDIWINMPKELSPCADRVFFKGILNKKYSFVSTKLQTVAFRSQYKAYYLLANQPPPTNAKDYVGKICLEYLKSEKGLKETIKKLGFYPL